MEDKLYVGFTKKIERPKGGYLLIADKVPKLLPKPRHPREDVRIFDPLKHCFNPLKDLNYRKACDIVEIFDALFSRGDSTLTKDTGLDFISEALEGNPGKLEELVPAPDKKASTGHVWAYSKVRRILRSPVLSHVLCNPTNFSFNPNSVILARLNRAKLGEFDALVLGLFLMAHFKGQLVVHDFGFYGRDMHASLIREGRLIAGVNFLDELPEKLRKNVMLIKDKVARGATLEDSETLAKYAGFRPDRLREDNDYNRYVREAMDL